MPKFQHFFLTPNRLRWLATIALVAAAALFANATWAADEPETGQPDNEPIQIVADKLISYNDDKYAEFIGNVKVTQADFTITSDKLRIYYQGELLQNEKKDSDKKVMKIF